MHPREEDMKGLLSFIAASVGTIIAALYGLFNTFPHLKAKIDVLLPISFLLWYVSLLLYLRYVKKAHPPLRYVLPPGEGSGR